jgi:hypothetical protein
VRRFRNILFALAAILWLPASAHCQFEKIPGLAFLACQTNANDSDCSEAGCCPVEKLPYKSIQIRVSIPSPDLLPLLPVALADIATTVSDTFNTVAFAAAPPELPGCWQFVFRTAAPPRAPSFTS